MRRPGVRDALSKPAHRIEHKLGGPLELVLDGILDLDATEALLRDLVPAVGKEGLRARVLEDMRGVTYISLQARKRAFGAIKEMRFDKWAVFGYSTFVGSLITGLLKTTGRGRVRFFASEAEARARLAQP